MPLHYFPLAPFTNSSFKNRMFTELAATLQAFWADSTEVSALVGNIAIHGKLIDAMIIRNNMICIFHFMEIGGRIEAKRTGFWKADGKPIKTLNPFVLLDQAAKFVGNELSSVKPISEVQGIALFWKSIIYDEHFSPITEKWFHIASIESLPKQESIFQRKSIFLNQQELSAILEKIGIDADLRVLLAKSTNLSHAVVDNIPNLNELKQEKANAPNLTPRNLLRTAQISFDSKKYFAAFREASLLIKKHPRMPGAHLLRGRTNAKLNQLAKAVDDFTQAIALVPAFAEAYFQRALVYIELSQDEEALYDLDQAIRFDNINSDYYQTRGEFLFGTRMYEQALRDFNNSIEKNPTAMAHYYRGCCFSNLQKRREAIADLKVAINLQNDFTIAKEALTKIQKATDI
jgi:tetratricopeptide (TPR) repeat protein